MLIITVIGLGAFLDEPNPILECSRYSWARSLCFRYGLGRDSIRYDDPEDQWQGLSKLTIRDIVCHCPRIVSEVLSRHSIGVGASRYVHLVPFLLTVLVGHFEIVRVSERSDDGKWPMPLYYTLGIAIFGAIVYMEWWRTENQSNLPRSKCIDLVLLFLSATIVTVVVEGARIL